MTRINCIPVQELTDRHLVVVSLNLTEVIPMIKPKRSKQCQNWGKEKSEKMHEKLAEKIDRRKPQERIKVWRKSECIQN